MERKTANLRACRAGKKHLAEIFSPLCGNLVFVLKLFSICFSLGDSTGLIIESIQVGNIFSFKLTGRVSFTNCKTLIFWRLSILI